MLDGRYGKPGHRRPRYRCYPSGVGGNGQRWHRFTEPLPRQMTVGGLCLECERTVHPSEGPPTPRSYEFAARDIARALKLVGSGVTYREAAAEVRRQANRMPLDEEGRERYSRHGQLVADYVEVFAPVVFEPHRRSSWPAGSVVVDEVSFRTAGLLPDGKPKPGGGTYLFRVYAAMAYDNGFPELVRLQAFLGNTTPEWAQFFSSLDGAPDRLVADGHHAIAKAARHAFPEVDYWVSEWHLKQAVERMLVRQGQHGDTRIMRALRQSLRNRWMWEHFTVVAHRFGGPRVNKWVRDNEQLVLSQLRRKHQPDERPPFDPYTTGGLETKLRSISDWLGPRAEALTNRARLDRLLMLMQLNLNGQDDEHAYTRAIRDWLEARDGYPLARRRIDDPRNQPSLRR